ncbi:uncharacterized protein EV420DRAFT_1482244 [Desarmillaria tabescens]|uniref:Uncharacterized protein n=1 Tax=Armillaria tabescens TaxID=1929756 RepID=A0AA39K0C9_ARMTA|nr:uncharacterized protein EV420DRAFT_1482244 [Desarmillaria tabescens]KAK0452159.1 hypothetical protein EV420DRAFT_1482244 [Desarmillaria tabescens]
MLRGVQNATMMERCSTAVALRLDQTAYHHSKSAYKAEFSEVNGSHIIMVKLRRLLRLSTVEDLEYLKVSRHLSEFLQRYYFVESGDNDVKVPQFVERQRTVVWVKDDFDTIEDERFKLGRTMDEGLTTVDEQCVSQAIFCKGWKMLIDERDIFRKKVFRVNGRNVRQVNEHARRVGMSSFRWRLLSRCGCGHEGKAVNTRQVKADQERDVHPRVSFIAPGKVILVVKRGETPFLQTGRAACR